MDDGILGSVVFVDDEPKVRMVVRKTLERVGVEVRCFASAEECLDSFESMECDLLITDVWMPPGKDGITLLTEVRKRSPWLPVLVVTGVGDVPMAVRALKEGAADFIEKPLDRDAFLKAVRSLLDGHRVSENIAMHSLTKTEMRVLLLIIEGKNNREIASILHRSPRTVEVHRSHLMHKMDANNVVELLRRAAEMGLFDPGQ